MLKEREFRTESIERPVDNRFGAGYNNRGGYGYYEEEQQRYDAYERSYEDRNYNSRYDENAYYDTAVREYPREDYARPEAFPRYDGYQQPMQGDPYQDYNASNSFEGYDRMQSYDFNSGFAAPQSTTFEHVEYETKKRTKRTLNAKSKMLIAVYFVLVAVIATLIIANVVAFGGGSVEATEPAAEATYSEEALNTAVSADGTLVEMDSVRQLENYEYEKSTNWFDSFCDWVASILD